MPLPNSDKFKNLANGDTTPPESGEQENTDAPAKPKGALKKSAAKKAKPEPEPEAPAADTAAAEDFKRSFVIPGEHGAVTITVGGHPHDVADTIIRIAF